MSVRLRRLQSDYEQIKARLNASQFIAIRKVTGDPPERYEIEYRVRSLVLQNDGQIVEAPSHVAEIILTRAYPHRAPHCKMLTPIFHPNIDPGAICIGDHWAASESLCDLIVRIGQMIAYQTYNTKSPLNGEAARWADEHKDLLPVDGTDLIPAEMESTPAVVPQPSIPQSSTAHCQNCGAPSSRQTLTKCVSGHLACPDCIVHCSNCGGTLCLLCESVACSICNKKGCARCLKTCADCGKAACVEHFVRCAQCGKESCSTCAGSCATCGKSFCKAHLRICKSCAQPLCAGCTGTCAICPPDSVHHKTELAKCAKCNALVCQSHLHASGVSGQKICDMCGTICAACGKWATHAEVVACGICKKVVCVACAKECRVCKKKVCPSHAGTCERHHDHVACHNCMTTCPICHKLVCKTQSHVEACSVCKRLVCHECAKTCADCGKGVCAEHIFPCPTCKTGVCSRCVDTCSICNNLFHTKHLKACPGCGRKLCPSCGKSCMRCKAIVCPEHGFPLSRGRVLCVPCYKHREKAIARIVLPSIVGGIIVLILVIWLIVRSAH